jgi:hypothetical protein
MYRSVISFLVLTLLVGSVIAINPQAREEATDLWEETKPTLVAWKDKALEVVQDLINGGSEAQIDHQPVSPELNIDIIITLSNEDYLL